MRGYVANTDYDWYHFLAASPEVDEVNFWRPTDTSAFRALPVGAPFFFKLKNPYYAICGFAFFATHSVLPAWLAWECFETKNGAESFTQMSLRIERLRRERKSDPAGNYKIGCLILSQPVFFDPSDWVEQPSDWSPNIVQGKTYDLTQGEGRRVWEACLSQAEKGQTATIGFDEQLPRVAVPLERFGSETTIRPRLGQGAFRVAVLDAYGRACAVSHEHSLPALESAHIKPYSESGTHEVSNGLLLRADIHRLFDLGYVTVTPDHHFEVSGRLREDYSNGRSYYPLKGQKIHLPKNVAHLPSPHVLEWHNSERFLG